MFAAWLVYYYLFSCDSAETLKIKKQGVLSEIFVRPPANTMNSWQFRFGMNLKEGTI